MCKRYLAERPAAADDDCDREAFSDLVEAHQNTALATALTYVGDPDDASDTVQDSCVAAYTSLGDLGQAERCGAWLRSSVRKNSLGRPPPKYRDVVLMYCLNSFTYRDIAELMRPDSAPHARAPTPSWRQLP